MLKQLKLVPFESDHIDSPLIHIDSILLIFAHAGAI